MTVFKVALPYGTLYTSVCLAPSYAIGERTIPEPECETDYVKAQKYVSSSPEQDVIFWSFIQNLGDPGRCAQLSYCLDYAPRGTHICPYVDVIRKYVEDDEKE